MLSIMYTSGSIHCGVASSLYCLRVEAPALCSREFPCRVHDLWWPHLDVTKDPTGWEFVRKWTLGGKEYELDIRNIQSRYVGIGTLEETAGFDESIRREVEFISRVDAVVLVLNTTRRYISNAHRRLRRVSADLHEAGRLDVPIIFQLGFRDLDPADADPERRPLPLDEIKQLFTWPRCDYVEAYPPQGRSVRETLNRGLGLYEEAKARHG
jgi:hypothetical protein